MNYNSFEIHLHRIPCTKSAELVDAISEICSRFHTYGSVTMRCESEHFEVSHVGIIRKDGSIQDANLPRAGFKQMVQSETNLWGDLTPPREVVRERIDENDTLSDCLFPEGESSPFLKVVASNGTPSEQQSSPSGESDAEIPL